MQKKTCRFYSIIIILLFLLSACKKDPVDINSDNLNAGRAAIHFNTDADFGNSKTFEVKNTNLTIATSMPVGSARRYMVLKAEQVYGGLDDTRRATLMITVPVPSTILPITIDLAAPMSSLPSAQVELYYSYAGGAFGNTYRSSSGQLKITRLSDMEIEGNFSAPVDGSIAPGYTLTNGTFAGKF